MSSRAANRPRPHPDGWAGAAGRAWRRLRTMRTALWLLAGVGAAAAVATVVPQRPNVPVTVDAWLAGEAGPGPVPARVAGALGLFDVFATPWFLFLLTLLFASLSGCLGIRYRTLVRTARTPPPGPPAAVPHRAELEVGADTDAVLAAAQAVLRRARYRAVTSGGGIAAERGHVSREAASLVFHTAFFVLLAGVVAGELTGFRGHVGVVEGAAFSDTAVAYWSADRGRWWRGGSHTGFVLGLDRFEVDWAPDGQPTTFVAHVTVDPRGDRPLFRDTVRVNDPLVVDGMKIHELDWGYAPRVVVHAGGQVVHDAFVPLVATDGGFWRGVVKAPAARPQLGVELALYPAAPDGPGGVPAPTPWPGPRAPLLAATAWAGDLRLDTAQGVRSLDTTAMRAVAGARIRPGAAADLGGGVTLEFPELRRWTGFQVSHRPTDPVLLAGAGLLLAALLPALYCYRRRVWVAAEPTSGGARVVVVGRAFQRDDVFAAELAGLVAALRRSLPPPKGAGGTARAPEPAGRAGDAGGGGRPR